MEIHIDNIKQITWHYSSDLEFLFATRWINRQVTQVVYVWHLIGLGVWSLLFPVSLSFLGFIIKDFTHKRLTMEILAVLVHLHHSLSEFQRPLNMIIVGVFIMWPKKLLQLHHSAYTVPYLVSSVSAAADVTLYVSVNLNIADLDVLMVKFFDSVIMSLKIFWQIVKKIKMLASPQPTHSFSLKCNNCTTIELFHSFQNKATSCFGNNHHFTLLSVLPVLFFPRQLALTLAWATGPPSGCDEKGYWGTLQDLQYKTKLMRCEGTFLLNMLPTSMYVLT